MGRALIVVLVTLSATGLAACGSDDGSDKPDDQAIEQVLSDYTDALADGDGKKACGFVAEEGKKQLETIGGGDCAKAITALSQLVPEPEKAKLRDLEVTSVKVDGDRATAEVRGASKPAQLQKVDGNWLIVDVDAG